MEGSALTCCGWKRYMTSASGMIGMEGRGSDGSYSSSSSSSSSAEGLESLEGQSVEPRLTDTRPAPLLKHSLIFCALFHGGYDSAYECVWMRFQSHIWSAYVLRSLPHQGQHGVLNVYILCPHCSHFFVLTFLWLMVLSFSLSSAFCHRCVELWTLYDSSGIAAASGLELHPHCVREGYQARHGEWPRTFWYPSAFLLSGCKSLQTQCMVILGHQINIIYRIFHIYRQVSLLIWDIIYIKSIFVL